MHYIRFLKTPKLVKQSGGKVALVAKITITTDLGESFLIEPIKLLVKLQNSDGTTVCRTSRYDWKGNGMRGLEVSTQSLSVEKSQEVQLVIMNDDETYGSWDGTASTKILHLDPPRSSGHLSAPNAGIILALRSLPFKLASGTPAFTGLAERVFRTPNDSRVTIWEETGESIARHVWDAGVVFAVFLDQFFEKTKSDVIIELPGLQKTLERDKLNVIELGAGCGVVGLHYALLAQEKEPRVLLTDLPEATEILEHNIDNLLTTIKPPSWNSACPPPNVTNSVLDWSEQLPETVSAQPWDLVLIADCTYNPDVVPDLVNTLSRIREGNPKVEIAVAMKVRHLSESIFFDLMDDARFVIKEECDFPLPVLGGDDEEISVYVFGSKL